MSVRHRSAHGGRTRLRAAVPILIVMSLASLSGAQLTSAEPPPTATSMTAEQARVAGSAIGIVHHAERGGELVELQLPAPRAINTAVPAIEQARRAAARFLDSAQTGALAIADGVGDPAAGLAIAQPDGSQVHTQLAGLAGAAFASDGSWLAAVDGAGRLWRIEARTGAASPLAPGPFTGSVRFTRSGELLLVQAASINAPFASVVVRLVPDSGRETIVEREDGFVFSASELPDASIAIVAHVFGGGVEVRRTADGSSARLASLHPGAIDATLSDDGTRIAYTVDGEVYLHDVPSGSALHLGAGEMPRIAPDGSSLLVLRNGKSILVAPDGAELEQFSTATVGWSRCDGRCGS